MRPSRSAACAARIVAAQFLDGAQSVPSRCTDPRTRLDKACIVQRLVPKSAPNQARRRFRLEAAN
eukprot:5816298-Alexandrium_andersonii.AAC.1